MRPFASLSVVNTRLKPNRVRCHLFFTIEGANHGQFELLLIIVSNVKAYLAFPHSRRIMRPQGSTGDWDLAMGIGASLLDSNKQNRENYRLPEASLSDHSRSQLGCLR